MFKGFGLAPPEWNVFLKKIATLMKNRQISHNSRLASLSPFFGGDEMASLVGSKGQISILKSKPYYVFT